jgi:hypothetical protein
MRAGAHSMPPGAGAGGAAGQVPDSAGSSGQLHYPDGLAPTQAALLPQQSYAQPGAQQQQQQQQVTITQAAPLPAGAHGQPQQPSQMAPEVPNGDVQLMLD